jgi:N-acetyl sugar amidotransferase
MKWCSRCILPDTRPNLRLDSEGICNACRAHEAKSVIDWPSRLEQLHRIVGVAKQRARENGYDCLIPVSGGKDSTWQTVRCIELGLKPLAVTWKTPARTAIGQANLQNLIGLGVDHIDWQINPKVEAKFMLKTFERFGSTAIPMHLALFNIPLTLAVRFGIPLVLWGENSAFEYGAADKGDTGFKLDAAWLKTYGVTHGTTAADWIDADLSAKDLAAYFGPTGVELDTAGVRAIFLGHFQQWDPEHTRRVAMEHGFRADTSGPRTGYYDYADIDDDFISIHHWMKWYKFGFTRLFDNLSLEIRNRRITRGHALEIVRKVGEQMPERDIEKFCRFAGVATEQFYAIAEKFRNLRIWQKRHDGVWYLPDFLLDDWKWV